MDDVKAVACGYDHTLILKTDGTLWACGGNTYGQVGNGKEGDVVVTREYTEGNSSVYIESQPHQPFPVKIMEDVAYISADLSVSAAVKTDGTLWTWGNNDEGQLGNGGGGNEINQNNDTPIQTVPAQIMEDVAQVSITFTNGAAVKTDGTLWVWGNPRYCGLGLTGSDDYVTTPTQIMDQVEKVAVGGTHTLARKTDGTLWAWGWAAEALGTGGKGDYTPPDDGAILQTVPVQLEFPDAMSDEELLDYLTEKGVKNLRVSQDNELETTIYVNLRDLAVLADGTAYQFNVDWKDQKVHLTTGVPYTTRTGGECQPIQGASDAQPGTLPLLVDGALAPETVRTIVVTDVRGGSHTFLSLTDLEGILK